MMWSCRPVRFGLCAFARAAVSRIRVLALYDAPRPPVCGKRHYFYDFGVCLPASTRRSRCSSPTSAWRSSSCRSTRATHVARDQEATADARRAAAPNGGDKPPGAGRGGGRGGSMLGMTPCTRICGRRRSSRSGRGLMGGAWTKYPLTAFFSIGNPLFAFSLRRAAIWAFDFACGLGLDTIGLYDVCVIICDSCGQ
ncbi:hypothetical protein DFH06DRAFT_359380 [Mycena polygramma]|nr:hypothetical protein DFH06DRAFT_359380 [Mycena polygramma]